MDKLIEKPTRNLSESIRQRLKNLAKLKNRPFDEILRYFAMERFLYRLSISSYVDRFYLKGGLMLKVWDETEHRATMDIDLLARTSNNIENISSIISDVVSISCEDDAITFNTEKLQLRESQLIGHYHGVTVSFSSKLFTSNIPILIDIGFNDLIIPEPRRLHFPTLLDMPKPVLLGYTHETVIAEKLESIVKLALINTRMKDFYDIWIVLKQYDVDMENLKEALLKVFQNRGTYFKYPTAFTEEFYNDKKVITRWENFLFSMGKEPISFKGVIDEISEKLNYLFYK